MVRHPGAGEVRDQAPESSDRASIVEALDDLPAGGLGGRGGSADVGRPALERLRGLGAGASGCARLTGLPLAELVGEAERALGLDIEVLARPEHTVATRPGPPRRLRRRRGELLGVRRPAHARRVPRLARRRGRAGARPGRRRHRGVARRRPGADGARGQGPGVGRRRRSRTGRGVVPGPQGARPARGEGDRWEVSELRDKGWCIGAGRRPLRPARRRRRPAPAALARRPGLGGPGQGLRRVRPRRWPARHRRGAPAGLRGADPGPLRAAAHRAGVGRRRHAAGHLAVPRRAARARPTWSAGPWVDMPVARRRPVAPTNPRLVEPGPPPVAGRPAREPPRSAGRRSRAWSRRPSRRRRGRRRHWTPRRRRSWTCCWPNERRPPPATRSSSRCRATCPRPTSCQLAADSRPVRHVAAAADAGRSGARRPAGHGLPRLGRAALPPGGVGRRRRPARAAPTRPPPTRSPAPSWPG